MLWNGFQFSFQLSSLRFLEDCGRVRGRLKEVNNIFYLASMGVLSVWKLSQLYTLSKT